MPHTVLPPVDGALGQTQDIDRRRRGCDPDHS
jgi:hypothetical protein